MRVSTTAVIDSAGSADAATIFAGRIGRYRPEWRPAIAAVAAEHPALSDLADSYPALLFAFASGFANRDLRHAAMTAVAAGAPLALAADTLGLAWWTRRLPAASLSDPLPHFPTDPDFSRRMANLLPDAAGSVAPWLRLVSEAVPAGGRQYTLWVARHALALDGTLTEAQRQAFHAWVWAGWHPGTRLHALVRRPWASDLGIKRVMDEFGCFLMRIALADALGEGTLGGLLAEHRVHNLTFRPLRTAADYVATAAALDNCLEQYADRLQRGTTAVAAIIERDTIIACVEVGPHPTEAAMPAIVQLRVAKNRRAPARLWAAAYAWLATADMRPLTAETIAPAIDEKQRIRQGLWGPFLDHLAAAPGAGAFHARARAAFDGEPPSLDAPAQARRAVLRATAARRDPAAAIHETLLERLVNLAGRGPAHRPHG